MIDIFHGMKKKQMIQVGCFRIQLSFFCFYVPGSSWYAKQMISYLLEGKGLFCPLLERFFRGSRSTSYQSSADRNIL